MFSPVNLSNPEEIWTIFPLVFPSLASVNQSNPDGDQDNKKHFLPNPQPILTQTYVNTGKQTLECVYVFPGSTQAAVYGLTMRIGKRTVKAKIVEREKARADYEQAKSEGKRASLLEQQRPNVFQMNVANITPGDTIEVELRYTELLVPENGD